MQLCELVAFCGRLKLSKQIKKAPKQKANPKICENAPIEVKGSVPQRIRQKLLDGKINGIPAHDRDKCLPQRCPI
jgi:hypothetical protein